MSGRVDRPDHVSSDVARGHTEPQQCAYDRTRRRPHDDVSAARVPAEVILQCREGASMICRPHDSAGPEDESDSHGHAMPHGMQHQTLDGPEQP
jgi:hypothetical protein